MRKILLSVLCIFVISCGNKEIKNDVVTVQSGSQTHEVLDAKILKIRDVVVESETEYGNIVGAIAGAGIGAEIAGDNSIGRGTGALVGGILGNAAGKELGKKRTAMKQYIVDILDTGERIAITQEQLNLSAGDKVLIIMSTPPQILK